MSFVGTMSDEQFSLVWNSFPRNLSSGLYTLLTDEHLVDVTLAAEGQILRAHKLILSVCSTYFRELFKVYYFSNENYNSFCVESIDPVICYTGKLMQTSYCNTERCQLSRFVGYAAFHVSRGGQYQAGGYRQFFESCRGSTNKRTDYRFG